jgi:hypothetical protein
VVAVGALGTARAEPVDLVVAETARLDQITAAPEAQTPEAVVAVQRPVHLHTMAPAETVVLA